MPTPDRFLQAFKMARQVGTSLIGLQTPDPQATIERLMAPCIPGAKGQPPTAAIAATSPVLIWDPVRGVRHGNKPGQEALVAPEFKKHIPQGMTPGKLSAEEAYAQSLAAATSHPVDMLTVALHLPRTSVLFMMNAHRFLGEGGQAGISFVQAVWNLRDPFKQTLRSLVLMGPSFTLPPELVNDVTMLDEPLPSDAELEAITLSMLENAQHAGDAHKVPKAVSALRGLSAFAAEQAVALCTDKVSGLDVDLLWEKKKRLISSTPGLGIWRGGETFKEIGGCDQIKKFGHMILHGRHPFEVVLFMDEVEKMMAGASGQDGTGVAQRQEQQFLSWAEDSGATGLTFVGPPGACKSQMAKAIGAEAGAVVIQFDFGAMMNSLVGASEDRTREAFKVVDAVGGGRVLMIATCNSTGALSGAFRRRFKMGTFYFDLLTDAERPLVWDIFLRRFELKTQKLPDDRGWTGAEIKQACLLAYDLNIPLAETGQFITPVCKTMAAEIENLRAEADGKYLSAAHPGFYTIHQAAPVEPAVGRRARATEPV